MLSQEHPINLSSSMTAAAASRSSSALMASTLRQALSACEQQNWAGTIAACEQVIALCNQNLANRNLANQNLAYQNLANYPPSVETHIRSAALHTEQQQWTEAEKAYQQALVLMPADSAPQAREQIKSALADVLFKLGEQRKHQGDITGAVRACLQALQHQPLFYQAYNRLRYNLMRYDIADHDTLLNEIVSVCEQNISQHLELQSAHIVLGYALTKLGRLNEAIACYRTASDFMTLRQLKRTTRTISDANPKILPQRLKPSFMVIGAEKCGTTSLYQYLAGHPQVLASVEKEIDFFDLEYSRGLDWYLSHFPAQPAALDPAASGDYASNHWISGETSANYLYSNVAPKRVFEQFPQIQLVVLLRHPVDRTISRYNMMVRNGVEKRSFEVAIAEEIQLIEQALSQTDSQTASQTDASSESESLPWPVLNRCRHIGNSLYVYHLQRWLQYFSVDQLLVLRSEDLFSSPEATLEQLCQTLKIAPPPKQAYQKYNAGEYDAIPPAVRQRLFDFYQPHIRKLETLLNSSFDWTSPEG